MVVSPGRRAVQFINLLTHTTGKYDRKPFELRPWQEAIIDPLFGTLNDQGLRRYRECGIWLPRKNGKSELAAAIAVMMLFDMSERRGQIYSAAAERGQASLVFNVAKQMIENEPELLQRVKIIDSQKRIVNHHNGTFYAAISADAKSKHGFNASCVIADEVHCWPNRDLWTALITSYGARTQPLTLTITTAGNYDKTTLEWELYDYACKVRDGILKDDSYLPVIYEAGQDDDWLDEEVWHKANPALGDFRSIDEMRKLAEKARSIPTLENDFRRLYLNQHTAQTTRWIPMHLWEACRVGELPAGSNEWFGGLDLSSKQDVTAFCLSRKTDSGYVLKSWFWIPQEVAAQKEQIDRVPYSTWIRQGYVETTPGDMIDQRVVFSRVKQICDEHNCRIVGVDPWNASQIMTELEESGYHPIQVPNTHRRMNEPCREVEASIASKQLLHEGNLCMDWMVANVEIKRNSEGHIKPDKGTTRERIDGVTAMVMSIGRAMHGEGEVFFSGPGVYV